MRASLCFILQVTYCWLLLKIQLPNRILDQRNEIPTLYQNLIF